MVLKTHLLFTCLLYSDGGVSNKQANEAIHAALKRGINYIDTAPLYAESQRRIGNAIADLRSDNAPLPILSTKVGDECPPYSDNGGHDAMSKDGVLHSFEHRLIYIARLCTHICTRLTLLTTCSACSKLFNISSSVFSHTQPQFARRRQDRHIIPARPYIRRTSRIPCPGRWHGGYGTTQAGRQHRPHRTRLC